jgi:hypothetical protein
MLIREVEKRVWMSNFWKRMFSIQWGFFCGFDTMKSIIDFLMENFIKDFMDMLSFFVLQVTKRW